MFAQAKVGPVPPIEPSANAIIPPSRVHGLEMPEDQNGKRHCRESHGHDARILSSSSPSNHDRQPEPADVQFPKEPVGLEAQRNVTDSDEIEKTPGVKGEERHAIDLASMKHGPKFLGLPANEQAWVLKLHRNLGHPGSPKLVEFCRQLKRILQAIPDLQCSTCKETQGPRIPRPGAIHEHGDFGDVVSMDGITWTNQQGEQFHFNHFLDQNTLYHTAICSASRTSQNACQALSQGWLQWAGAPKLIVMDAASEFNSEEFGMFLQKFGIKSRTCAAEGH